MVWAGESFDFETAKEIQNAEGYTENCGTICVGVSHDHIEKLLRDPNIRMVIPYHKSGLNPIVAHMNKIAEFTDYTNDQRTKGKDGKALKKDFDFSKAMHDMGDQASPKAVADQYLKWCVANGYTAKFAEFAAEDNYYKLLEDFTLYDKDGNYVPQREVKAVFPKANSAFGSMKDLIREGLEEDAIIEGKRDKNLSSIVDEIQKTLPKTEAETAETQVEQADRDLESDIKLSHRYSARSFADQVDFVLNGADTNSSHLKVMETPKLLQDAGLPDLPILMTAKHLKKITATSGHDLAVETVKKLPEYISDPVLIADSLIRGDSIVVITEAVDSENRPVMAAIMLDGVGRLDSKHISANIMTSAYGRENFQGFLNRLAENNAVIYWNNKKSQDLSVSLGVQFPNAIMSLDSNIILRQTKAVVKRQERSTDSVSNRSLLANAFEGATQNQIEEQAIDEYKRIIPLLDSAERKLQRLNEQIKELSFAKGHRDAKKKGKDALAAYREKAAKTQREIIERNKEARRSGVESRERTAMRHKIQNVVGDLNDLLLNESKQRHIPDNLKKAVATALDMVNMAPMDAENQIAKYEAMIARTTDADKIAAYQMAIERIQGQAYKMQVRYLYLFNLSPKAAADPEAMWHCCPDCCVPS